jgi:hypothetical protein
MATREPRSGKYSTRSLIKLISAYRLCRGRADPGTAPGTIGGEAGSLIGCAVRRSLPAGDRRPPRRRALGGDHPLSCLSRRSALNTLRDTPSPCTNSLAPFAAFAGRGRKPRAAWIPGEGRTAAPALRVALQFRRRPSPQPSPGRRGEGVSRGSDPPMRNFHGWSELAMRRIERHWPVLRHSRGHGRADQSSR